MYVYVVTRLMNGETSVFGDAFPTRTAAEEAIKIGYGIWKKTIRSANVRTTRSTS
jgi:hypothetical protein